MCDSELFDHVSKIHKSNPTIHVYELANLFNCRHSKNRLFEFVCQYFESPKLIQFRSHRQTVPISPLDCVAIDFILKLWFSNLYTRGMPHAVTESVVRKFTPYSMCYQLLRCRNTRGINYLRGWRLLRVSSILGRILFGTHNAFIFRQHFPLT